ncbi:MAG: FtsX-like permease family protein [Opitutae bacterium]
MSVPLQLALRYVFSRRRAMCMSLVGIVFGISFFIVTQAQTSGFQAFFIKTILGTNGAIRISDRFQDMDGIVRKVLDDGEVKFVFKSRKDSRYVEGIDYPNKLRDALKYFKSVSGVSEIIETNGVLDSESRTHPVQVHGLRIEDHVMVSNIENQLLQGSVEIFKTDQMGLLVGHRIAERMRLQIGDRVNLMGGTQNFQLRVSGIFETGVSEIDKKRVYMDLATVRSFSGKRFGGSVFQISLADPEVATEIASQIQQTLGHRTISWQEREKVWLDVFNVLRISSAITVSSILLLSGLGMFNVFAIMVIEKTRDIAILRSMGFTPRDVSAIFLWQGAIVLTAGIVIGSAVGFLATYGISKIPLRIRGVFTADSFVVNWDVNHYLWAIIIATIFVSFASWIPARRAARVEPAKIIRETI